MIKSPQPFVGAAYDSLQAVVGRTGEDKRAFLNDALLQDATLMRLMDAGEQLSRLRDGFPDFYAANSSPAWDKLIGLRNIIAHGYLMIDHEIIWSIIQDNLPQLIAELGALL